MNRLIRTWRAWRDDVAYRRDCAASAAHCRALVADGNPYVEVLLNRAEQLEAEANKVQV